jgi:sec-independent protein translocase protein TatB
MFGISLGEFFVILLVAILVIRPKDFPDIARNIIKAIAKGKNILDKAKSELNLLGKEIGIEEIKNEIAVEIANEKTKIEQEITTIIDIYGNEHHVSNIEKIRKDKSKEEIDLEIAKYNQENSNRSNVNP